MINIEYNCLSYKCRSLESILIDNKVGSSRMNVNQDIGLLDN